MEGSVWVQGLGILKPPELKDDPEPRTLPLLGGGQFAELQRFRIGLLDITHGYYTLVPNPALIMKAPISESPYGNLYKNP